MTSNYLSRFGERITRRDPNALKKFLGCTVIGSFILDAGVRLANTDRSTGAAITLIGGALSTYGAYKGTREFAKSRRDEMNIDNRIDEVFGVSPEEGQPD